MDKGLIWLRRRLFSAFHFAAVTVVLQRCPNGAVFLGNNEPRDRDQYEKVHIVDKYHLR